METEIIVTAPRVEEAIEEALEKLGIAREEAEIEILEEPTKKLFGGSIDAKVLVRIKGEKTVQGDGLEAIAEEHENSENRQNTEEIYVEEEILIEDPSVTQGLFEENINEEDNKEEAEDYNEEQANVAIDEEDEDIEDERNYNESLKQLSEEELDLIADTAIETIKTLLRFFGFESVEIDEYEGDEGELILDIIGENLAVLIGRHGKTLDSLQFLVTSIVSKQTGFRYPVIVDVESYKHRRKQKLVSIAKSSATRAIRQKKEVKLHPMTPYERRIVHIALRQDKRVVTSSEGVEPNRYIVIKLV